MNAYKKGYMRKEADWREDLPLVTGSTLAGGGLGAYVDDKNRLRGAIVGALLGGAGGFSASRLLRMIGKEFDKDKPTPFLNMPSLTEEGKLTLRGEFTGENKIHREAIKRVGPDIHVESMKQYDREHPQGLWDHIVEGQRKSARNPEGPIEHFARHVSPHAAYLRGYDSPRIYKNLASLIGAKVGVVDGIYNYFIGERDPYKVTPEGYSGGSR